MQLHDKNENKINKKHELTRKYTFSTFNFQELIDPGRDEGYFRSCT